MKEKRKIATTAIRMFIGTPILPSDCDCNVERYEKT